jgi:hypothetical protein
MPLAPVLPKPRLAKCDHRTLKTTFRTSLDELYVPALKEKQNTVSAVVTCSLMIWNAAIYCSQVARDSVMVLLC